jgi:hypothetical protein
MVAGKPDRDHVIQQLEFIMENADDILLLPIPERRKHGKK